MVLVVGNTGERGTVAVSAIVRNQEEADTGVVSDRFFTGGYGRVPVSLVSGREVMTMGHANVWGGSFQADLYLSRGGESRFVKRGGKQFCKEAGQIREWWLELGLTQVGPFHRFQPVDLQV